MRAQPVKHEYKHIINIQSGVSGYSEAPKDGESSQEHDSYPVPLSYEA